MNKQQEKKIKQKDRFEKINTRLARRLFEHDEAMFKKVIEQSKCDIDGSFLGFVDTYYYLSRLIPLDWTIYDFGCAYAPQAFYFRKHKSYIGVNPDKNLVKFSFPNTVHSQMTIKEYLGSTDFSDKKCFAICNYVPSGEVKMVKGRFRNLFIYYPE